MNKKKKLHFHNLLNPWYLCYPWLNHLRFLGLFVFILKILRIDAKNLFHSFATPHFIGTVALRNEKKNRGDLSHGESSLSLRLSDSARGIPEVLREIHLLFSLHFFDLQHLSNRLVLSFKDLPWGGRKVLALKPLPIWFIESLLFLRVFRKSWGLIRDGIKKKTIITLFELWLMSLTKNF